MHARVERIPVAMVAALVGIGVVGCTGRAPVFTAPSTPAAARTWTWVAPPGARHDAGTIALLRTEVAAALEMRGWQRVDSGSASLVITAGLASAGAAPADAEPFSTADVSDAFGRRTDPVDPIETVCEPTRRPPLVCITQRGSLLRGTSRPIAPSVPFGPLVPPVAREPIVATPGDGGQVVLVVVDRATAHRTVSRSSTRVPSLVFWGDRPTSADTAWTRRLLQQAIDEAVRVPAR